MTEEELHALLKRNPQVSAVETNNRRQVQNTEREPNQVVALASQPQAPTSSFSRIEVRFTGYRVKKLDRGNFAASCKDLLDGLRYAGLIPDDSEEEIEESWRQEKVAHYAEERTVIEIIYPEPNNNQPEELEL